MTPKSVARGILFAIGSFLALGTVTALWPNPFFIRMTPTGSFEVALLAAQSVLLGAYLAIPVAACATKLAGTGGVANFLGVACPICNKVLVFLFGAQALLTYLEPARIYLAAAGALITGIAVVFRWRRFHASQAGSVLAAHGCTPTLAADAAALPPKAGAQFAPWGGPAVLRRPPEPGRGQ